MYKVITDYGIVHFDDLQSLYDYIVYLDTQKKIIDQQIATINNSGFRVFSSQLNEKGETRFVELFSESIAEKFFLEKGVKNGISTR